MATKFMDTDAQHQVGIVDRQLTLTEAVVPVGVGAAAATTSAPGVATGASAPPPPATSSTEATVSGSAQSASVDEAPSGAAASASGSSAPAQEAGGAVAGPGAEKSGSSLLDGLKIVAQNAAAQSREERLNAGQAPVVFDTADSPACTDCGSIMVRNGSCYKCINCGATSGCS
jgi:ribonucleoside-diphosphate reductase alpha chain